jgi:hypothetical protein
MADEIVMPAWETKVVMLPHETLNSWCHVTFGTQVALWIRKCRAEFCTHSGV